MTTVSLQFHPSRPPTAKFSLSGNVAYGPHQDLTLQFELLGDVERLLTATPTTRPSRRDGLWQATCFEAFIRFEPDAGYREYNFSPSGDWAIYDFSDYRSGMTPTDVAIAPKVSMERSSQRLFIEAHLDRSLLLLPKPSHNGGSPLRLGLSVILLETDGAMSFWALHHPTPTPDFHDSKGFCLSLPRAPQTFITQDL
ncbi:MAG: hypothetical protein EBT06_06515 [Gammaproteobacteria bacterium]|nr:hypothetical protein [Gammaproteobacteria bacterium]NBT44564.1 hypothetical protein [Gammaproteobacteria bacterium]NBY22511.1 hypothetical protein [Gammaproteobacteria bacterium]NDE55471.1 hypothetical protein [Gammaproteobacteria bacterium]